MIRDTRSRIAEIHSPHVTSNLAPLLKKVHDWPCESDRLALGLGTVSSLKSRFCPQLVLALGLLASFLLTR